MPDHPPPQYPSWPDSYCAYAGTILWQSPIRKIGKHDWRITAYCDKHHGNGFDYEWRLSEQVIMGQTFPAEHFRPAKDWPRYDGDDAYAGMPRTLKRFYEQHKDEIHAALNPPPPAAEAAAEMSPSP